jgi:hypothetical protein
VRTAQCDEMQWGQTDDTAAALDPFSKHSRVINSLIKGGAGSLTPINSETRVLGRFSGILPPPSGFRSRAHSMSDSAIMRLLTTSGSSSTEAHFMQVIPKIAHSVGELRWLCPVTKL